MGGPSTPVAPDRNHGRAVASVLKNQRSMPATFAAPCADGCVPSDSLRSGHSQVKPSPLGTNPSAHKYGPHESHGATTSPCEGSKLRPESPWICPAMSHFVAKPDSYAYGSGLSAVVAYPA